MGLVNMPGFFQYRTEKLLGVFLWQFVLVYVNNIIIYSLSLESRLRHLNQVEQRIMFSKFENILIMTVDDSQIDLSIPGSFRRLRTAWRRQGETKMVRQTCPSHLPRSIMLTFRTFRAKSKRIIDFKTRYMTLTSMNHWTW